MASETEWAWLAGIIDGEGTIALVRHAGKAYRKQPYYALRVLVSNTDPRIVRRCHEITGVGSIRFYRRQKPQHRPIYLWTVSTKNAATVLVAILPHLVGKKDQAEIALESRRFMRRPGEHFNQHGNHLAWLKQQLHTLHWENHEMDIATTRPALKEVQLTLGDE